MAFSGIPKTGLLFLRQLAANNDRGWFEAHRSAWDDELLPAMISACSALQARLRDVLPRLTFVPRVGGSLYRLSRDVRFSKDKRPYKTHTAALLWDGPDKHASPGVYLHVSHDTVIFGGGLYAFQETQLERFRQRLLHDGAGEAIVRALARAKKAGLDPAGEQLVRPPRGFPADHPRADLARHKGLVVGLTHKPGSWLHGDEFLDRAEDAARAYAPLHRWLREEVCS
jgi:uncharacterized protein (TIGR02453 family)